MKFFIVAALLLVGIIAGAQKPYFQQRVDTRLTVRLDDEKHFLHGFEAFSYTNNSPDTLRYIYLHLYPNAYLHDHTPFAEQMAISGNSAFYYSKPSQRGYIDSLDVRIDGVSTSLFPTDAAPDIARIDLPKTLPPGGSFELTTPFRVKIPQVFSRLGHSRQAYYISQWFPKPAVYDNKGWHPMSYLDQGEFYSEIGSYEVTLTLPKNYVVMATGNCMDEEENSWLDSLSTLPLPELSHSVKSGKLWRESMNRFPPSDLTLKTIHFEEDNIHDFAFFADKRFIVRKDTIQINGGAKLVTAFAAFLPASKKAWLKGTDYLKETVSVLSREVGSYPYKTIKAAEGELKAGSGMEYPTVTIIDNSIATQGMLKSVIVHEAGHNWFQGIIASNERDNPWLDEGINSFYEQKITGESRNDDILKKKATISTTTLADELYYEGVASGTDQAFALPATAYTSYNYGSDVYQKTPIFLGWLEDYMGEDAFRSGMQDYYNNWQHKHPDPTDFEASMKLQTQKSLDWFFRDAAATRTRVDFSLKIVRNMGDYQLAIIKNRSAFAAPVRIDAYRHNQILDTFWTAPFIGKTTIKLQNDFADSWQIASVGPDAKLSNNRYTKQGIFHGRGIRPVIGIGLRRSYHERLFLLPAVGRNSYDGFMGGILLHNLSLPDQNFRFAFAPMYGFTSRKFVGTGAAGYFFHPAADAIQEIIAGTEIKTFHYDKTDYHTEVTLNARFLKVAPYATITFKNALPTSHIKNQLTGKGYYIRENLFAFTKAPFDTIYKPSIISQEKTYGLLQFKHSNNRLFNPYSYQMEGQIGSDFAKLSLEGNLRIDYHKKNKSLYIRAYAGKFITINNNDFLADRYWLNATFTGQNDYLYDETYLARSDRDGIFHQEETPANGNGFRGFHQVSVKEGGLKIPTDYYASPLGRTDDWLASINLKTDLPLGKIPLRLYFDLSTFANAARENPSGNRFLYSAGFELHLLYDVLVINVPVVFSKDYKDYLKSIYPTNRLLNTVSFTLNLQNINWLRSVSGGLKLSER